jgi:hypothetical protein
VYTVSSRANSFACNDGGEFRGVTHGDFDASATIFRDSAAHSSAVRTELYQILYEKPIYPKTLYLKRKPMKLTEYRQKVIKRRVRLMHDRGIWKKPER